MFHSSVSGVKAVNDNCCQKLLRVCVFQHGENAGAFERNIIRIYNFFTRRGCHDGYDPARAQRGISFLHQLGGETFSLKVQNYLIDTMQICPIALEKKIQSLGGSWEKKVLRDGQTVLAIVPPIIQREEWTSFERALLHLKWPKREGLIITSFFAEAPPNNYLFIQANSATTSYVMMKKRIGILLGCKQKVCVFDPPGTGLSKGRASEGVFYETIKTVFERYAKDYPVERVWVCAACLGCLSAAYLKSQVPGINLVLENGFVDMQEDMIKPEGRFVSWFANRYKQSLLRSSPEETGFNIARMWEKLPNSKLGKVIVISIENDQRLAKSVAAHLISIASRISEVAHISYRSPNRDTHASRVDDFPDTLKNVTQLIFQK